MADPIEVEIESMSSKGVGIGRYKRRTVFIPYTIPGEIVLASATRAPHEELHAVGKRLIAASADRVYPVCEHFGLHQCGLCQWQHITYEAQLLIKQDVLAEQLERGGVKNAPVQAVIPSPSQFGFNYHMTFAVSGEGDDLYLGFASSDDDERIIPITECHVLHPDLLDLYHQLDLELKGLRRVKLQMGTDGGQMLIITSLEDAAPELETDLPISVNLILPNNEPMNLIGDSHSRYTINAAGQTRDFRVTAGSYFRANVEAIPALIETTLTLLDVQPDESVLDLYAGVGVFSAFLADRAALVTMVESYPPAVTDADDNLSDFDHVDVFEGGAEGVLESLEDAYQAAVVDPGTRGLSEDVIRSMSELDVKRIAYISGDPATLARDVKRLGKFGYQLRVVQPVDLAPQTYYMDMVALFGRGR